MKRFGYLRDYLHFNIYNPSKIVYAQHPVYGNLELPKYPSKGAHNIKEQAKNYRRRLEFEKYLNPKGLKPTITSKFAQPQQQVDFANLSLHRISSGKYYGPNVICFLSPPGLSKPEVRQYLTKLYQLPIISLHSVLRQGKLMRNLMNGRYWRKKDTKKWIVKLAIKPHRTKRSKGSKLEDKTKKPVPQSNSKEKAKEANTTASSSI